jgi:membrane-bound metal-dependent hydrolase YbcI (DUF457 family)
MAGDARLPLLASLRQGASLFAAAAVLACLPDVDYLPGLLRGYLNTAHQQATHGVPWVLATAAGIWLLGRAWNPARFGWRAFVFLLLLIGSHLVVDLLTEDRRHRMAFRWARRLRRLPCAVPLALLPAWDRPRARWKSGAAGHSCARLGIRIRARD